MFKCNETFKETLPCSRWRFHRGPHWRVSEDKRARITWGEGIAPLLQLSGTSKFAPPAWPEDCQSDTFVE